MKGYRGSGKQAIPITLFRLLDAIAKEGNIADQAWAEASGLKYHPRIAEFRRIGRGETVKRAFTLEKFQKLTGGLVFLMGQEKVKEQILRKLDMLKTEDEKIFALMAILTHENKQKTREHMQLLLASQKKE